MLILQGPNDRVQIVAAQAVNALHVHASYVDNAGCTVTPGRRNLTVSTAGATDAVLAPASGGFRNIKQLQISNRDGSLSTYVSVRHTDGTTAVDIAGATLLPNESLVLDDHGVWAHYDANGAVYDPSVLSNLDFALSAAGTIAETIPRSLCLETSLSALTSGTLYLCAIHLRAGQRVNAISVASGTTAAASPLNQWFALYDQNRGLLRQTVNDTTNAWAGSTIKTLALTSQYTVTYTGLHYVGIMVEATTVPTLRGLAKGTVVSALPPTLHGNSTAGLTTTAPATAAAITATANAVWARLT